jgi:hypothetical protein
MKRAMAAAHQESYQCTCLSRYDLFVGYAAPPWAASSIHSASKPYTH